jgi:hypothetical protein
MIKKPTMQPSAVVTHTKSVLADLPMLARETKASQLTKKGDILTSHGTERQRETA